RASDVPVARPATTCRPAGPCHSPRAGPRRAARAARRAVPRRSPVPETRPATTTPAQRPPQKANVLNTPTAARPRVARRCQRWLVSWLRTLGQAHAGESSELAQEPVLEISVLCGRRRALAPL